MSKDLFKAYLHLQNLPHSTCVIDSRHVEKDAIFFALPGSRVDGHQFVGQAFEKGACLCVVEKKKLASLPKLGDYLVVEDSFEALCAFATWRCKEANVPILAITGSVGKTTTKDMLHTLLQQAFKVYASPKSYNSQNTLPLNLLNAPKDKDLWVLEMGLSMGGELKKLVDMAPPTYALLTGVYASHLEFFENLQALAMEKAQIFSHPQTKWGMMHQGVYYQKNIVQVGVCEKKVLSKTQGDYTLGEGELLKEGRSWVGLKHLPLQHHENVFLAVSAAKALGMSDDQIAKGVLAMHPSEGRGVLIQHGEIAYIDDCYNAAPHAVIQSLINMPPASGKKLAFLTDMLELGTKSTSYHQEVLDVAFTHCDILITLGSTFASLYQKETVKGKKWLAFEDFFSAFECLRDVSKQGDVVLIKGARFFQLEKIFTLLGISRDRSECTQSPI